jgi:carbamoyltransferase
MKARLNERVKRRESFRPFAPAALEEHAETWFGLSNSPFMLRVAPVLRAGVPAVTHVDGTARIQTVTRSESPEFYELISNFLAITQVPMVLNTSFNADGEPIVETPDDAIACFLNCGIDALVFPEVVITPRA